MRKTTRHSRMRGLNVFISSVSGILSALICLVIFSLIMLIVDLPDGVISVMADIALCIGSYFASFSVSVRKRRYGIITGISVGLVIFLFVFLINIIFIRNGISGRAIAKFAVIMISAVAGGIVGVNSKLKRY